MQETKFFAIFQICDKSRDLLGGTLSHEAILRLISERCNRLIVIVSPAFLKSRANTFFTSCAQSIGISTIRIKRFKQIFISN